MAEENVQAESQQIQVDGVSYDVDALPEGLQQAIATYGRWQTKANSVQEELNMVLAIRLLQQFAN